MNNEKIKDFYNDFVNYQTTSGINERIYTLYKKMLFLDLRSSSKVLELGCGIGVMTKMLSSVIKTGFIEAVDLSDKSVELAKSKVVQKNISFFTDDVVSYLPKNKDFDFITLFDVIEHIPIEKHPDLFRNLSEIAGNHTKILVNIPNPEFIDFHLKKQTSSLQIIDQPIPLHAIVNNAEQNGLKISNFNTYSIWVENDYQFFIIEKQKVYNEISVSNSRNIWQKVICKVKNLFIQIRYN